MCQKSAHKPSNHNEDEPYNVADGSNKVPAGKRSIKKVENEDPDSKDTVNQHPNEEEEPDNLVD